MDRDKHGGEILIYVRNDIPSNEVKTLNIGGNTEGIFVEVNFRKCKWLLLAAYKPPDVSKLNNFNSITKISGLSWKQVLRYDSNGRFKRIGH